MFNSDFYPTPQPVIDTMLQGVSLEDKIILEPSVGSGNLVKAMKQAGAKDVLGCENDPSLIKIAKTFCNIIEEDFLKLTSDKISHIDLIIMNPPFSKAADHIIHAYKIAPDGCQIVALCNYETLNNPYSRTREELKSIVDTYGQFQELGNVFSTAERKTEVNVALVRLQKPGTYKNEFEGFFLDGDEEEQQSNGIISYNAVRDLVNRYVECVKIYDQQLETAVKLSEMRKDYFDKDYEREDRQRESGTLSISITKGGVPIARNQFKKQMQKAGWRWIFEKMNLEKTSTRGLREDINRFVEKQENIPFTMKNIYHMLDMVNQTTGQRMDKAILEVFDKVTRHCDDNRYGLEGWKTNSHYLLTRRFILPYLTSPSWHGNGTWNINHDSSRYEVIDDLHKSLCYISGQNYDEIGSVWEMNKIKDKPWGAWVEFGFFRMKAFKKGTMHIEFKDEDLWARFNQRVAKLKGYPLPEKKNRPLIRKNRQDLRKQKQHTNRWHNSQFEK